MYIDFVMFYCLVTLCHHCGTHTVLIFPLRGYFLQHTYSTTFLILFIQIVWAGDVTKKTQFWCGFYQMFTCQSTCSLKHVSVAIPEAYAHFSCVNFSVALAQCQCRTLPGLVS